MGAAFRENRHEDPLEPTFQPIEFEVQSSALIAREGETPFVVDRPIPLGAAV
jgi:hypothetical protein